MPGSIQVITSNKVDGRQVSFNLQVHLLQHPVQILQPCTHTLVYSLQQAVRSAAVPAPERLPGCIIEGPHLL